MSMQADSEWLSLIVRLSTLAEQLFCLIPFSGSAFVGETSKLEIERHLCKSHHRRCISIEQFASLNDCELSLCDGAHLATMNTALHAGWSQNEQVLQRGDGHIANGDTLSKLHIHLSISGGLGGFPW